MNLPAAADPKRDLETILILAPTGQDATLVAQVLRKEGISAEISSNMDQLGQRVQSSHGAILIAEEALNRASLAQLSAILNAQEPWSDVPLILMTTGGETTLASMRITKELSPAGNVTLLERPFRPITLVSAVQVALRARRKQYQMRDLLEEQRAATNMRDEFISVASHELKTPLTSLKLQTQLNRRQLEKSGGVPNSEYVTRLVEVTSRQVERLGRLVEDMLDVSRINTGRLKLEKETVNLSELVRELAERMTTQLSSAGITVQLEVEDHIVGVWDRYRLEQVLSNLLTNAIRYAPGKPVKITAQLDGSEAVVTVADQGPGIAPENRERIFSRFERAANSKNIDGLGLGLYICRQILESHGGSIRVESAEGGGALFVIRIPLT